MPWWHEVVWPNAAEWVRLPLVVLALGGLIGLGEIFRKLIHLSPEFSRKFVHIAVGAALLLAPSIFVSPIPLLILSILFAASNGIAIKAGWLKGIHGPSRRSLGTVYFPISLFILTLLYWHRSPELVVLAMFVFSMGDAAAAVVGESVKRPTLYSLSGDQKSIEGSVAMFAATWLSVVAGSWLLFPNLAASWQFIALMAAAAAVVGTAWEALSSRGLDNITVPISHGFVLAIFILPLEGTSVTQLSLGMVLGVGVAAAAYYARALSASGAVATSILAAIVFGLGGWKWTLPIVAFFVLSSALSFVGRAWKADLENLFEKSSTRDFGQVAANGGIAGSLVILQVAVPSIDWFPAYIGAIAAVTADSWGTEVGVLSRGKTVSLIGFREVDRGTNGGVTIAGSLAGMAGAALIGMIGAQWTESAATVTIAVAAGVAGAVTDSLLGERYQARFLCVVCGKATERSAHCNRPAKHIGGFRHFRNDGVNWACAAVGALVAAILTIR